MFYLIQGWNISNQGSDFSVLLIKIFEFIFAQGSVFVFDAVLNQSQFQGQSHDVSYIFFATHASYTTVYNSDKVYERKD